METTFSSLFRKAAGEPSVVVIDVLRALGASSAGANWDFGDTNVLIFV